MVPTKLNEPQSRTVPDALASRGGLLNEAMTAMGHERRHSPSKPSVRSYGAERTFTEVSENGRDAPIPAIR
jgi:hypothetical protein